MHTAVQMLTINSFPWHEDLCQVEHTSSTTLMKVLMKFAEVVVPLRDWNRGSWTGTEWLSSVSWFPTPASQHYWRWQGSRVPRSAHVSRNVYTHSLSLYLSLPLSIQVNLFNRFVLIYHRFVLIVWCVAMFLVVQSVCPYNFWITSLPHGVPVRLWHVCPFPCPMGLVH